MRRIRVVASVFSLFALVIPGAEFLVTNYEVAVTKKPASRCLLLNGNACMKGPPVLNV